MELHTQTGPDGRITATSPNDDLPGGFLQEFPDGFDFGDQRNWRVEGGALVRDPSPETLAEEAERAEAEAAPTPAEAAAALVELARMLSEQEDAICELSSMIGGE